MDKHREQRSRLIRNVDFGQRLELFLVASVASVIIIRAYLSATGYPEIGGQGLHIAHMLWGGMFMVFALFAHAAFLNRSVHRLAAILAGIGFGTFIDELGKFITSDNNYFFQPTIAIIYIIFVLGYIFARVVYARRPITGPEALANALSLSADAIAGRVNTGQKQRILALLDSANSTEPVVAEFRDLIERIHVQDTVYVGLYFRLRNALAGAFQYLLRHHWFRYLMVGGFAGNTLWQLFTVGDVVLDLPLLTFGRATETSDLVTWVQAASLLGSVLLIVVGVSRLGTSRLAAYRWFQRSVLIQVLITQVFVFYDTQMGALGGVFLNLFVYIGFSLTIAHLAHREPSGIPDVSIELVRTAN